MARLRGLAFLLVLLMISTPLAGCLDSFSGNNAPTSTFSMTPNSNVRACDEITFNAAALQILMVIRSHLPGILVMEIQVLD